MANGIGITTRLGAGKCLAIKCHVFVIDRVLCICRHTSRCRLLVGRRFPGPADINSAYENDNVIHTPWRLRNLDGQADLFQFRRRYRNLHQRRRLEQKHANQDLSIMNISNLPRTPT